MYRPRYKAPECPYHLEGGHVVSEGDIRHKVTGTSMAGILGCSPWSSPFQVACSLLGLCREDLDGKSAVETGKILEPVVISYLGKTYPTVGAFFPAEFIYEKRQGDHDSWESDFQDDVFAGHVDGIVTSPEGVDRILEIKTSANMDSWADGVPEYYFWQIALYNEFIAKQNSAVVGLGIVDETTYRNPLSWAPNDRNVVLFEMAIDREKVREGMMKVQDWYNEYIVNGTTPHYDPTNPKDVAMYHHLKALVEDVSVVQESVDRISELNYQIKMAEAEIQQKRDELDELKDNVKNYMAAHDLSDLDGLDGSGAVRLSSVKRGTIDRNMLMQDGIDPDKYTKYTETFSLRIMERRD